MLDQRARNRAATEQRILDAVHQLVTEEHPAAISMPLVAERADVGLRTLYRYFPTKEALLDAASRSMSRDATRAVGGEPTLATMGEYLRIHWTGFHERLGAVTAEHVTPTGRDLRARRLPGTRRVVREALVEDGLDLPGDDLDRLVDLVTLLSSSSAFLELVDRLGHDPGDAARLATWAIETVTDRARRDGTVAP